METDSLRQYTCSECGSALECRVVLDAHETLSGKEERLCVCKQCLSSWEVRTNWNGEFEIHRYFFG